jgi:hypothetical protein
LREKERRDEKKRKKIRTLTETLDGVTDLRSGSGDEKCGRGVRGSGGGNELVRVVIIDRSPERGGMGGGNDGIGTHL